MRAHYYERHHARVGAVVVGPNRCDPSRYIPLPPHNHEEIARVEAAIVERVAPGQWRKHFKELTAYMSGDDVPKNCRGKSARKKLHGRVNWKRKESLAALAKITCYLAQRTDLLSWRIGKIVDGKRGRCIGVTEEKISKETRVHPSTVNRAIRAMRYAGWFASSKQPRERRIDPTTGEKLYAGCAAIRCWSRRFFERLGCLLTMQRLRDKKSDEITEATKKEHAAPAKAAPVRSMVRALVEGHTYSDPRDSWLPAPPRPPPLK